MSDINSGNVDPDQSAPDSIAPSPDGIQLSRLGSVLNGLESGALAMRRHVLQAMRAVRSGTYKVDPVQLSRRIVGETMGSARKLSGIGRREKELEKGSTSFRSSASQI